MKLVYNANPHPTLNLVDDGNLNWVLKAIGVSSYKAATKIANAVADGVMTADDLMDSSFATGSDVITKYNL